MEVLEKYLSHTIPLLTPRAPRNDTSYCKPKPRVYFLTNLFLIVSPLCFRFNKKNIKNLNKEKNKKSKIIM